MRIGFDISTCAFNSAGNARYSLRLLEALKQEIASTGDTLVPLQLPDWLQTVRAGLKRKITSVFWELVYAPYLTQLLARRSGCDLIHFTAPTPILEGRALDRRSRIITTVLDVIPVIYPEWFPPTMSMRLRRWIKLAAHRSDHLITISHQTSLDLQRVLPQLCTPITETYLGPLLDDHTFQPITAPVTDDQFILSVGTLEPRKNLASVLQAYSTLKHIRGSLPRLVVVGASGWMTHNIHQHAATLGIDRDLVVTGFVSDAELVDLYRRATMLVYPSLYEGFGLPVLEAMKLGCPVITSDRSSLPEVAGDAAVLIDPTNTRQLADAIHLLLNQPSLRSALRSKGLDQAARFSWQACAQQTLAAYRKALDT